MISVEKCTLIINGQWFGKKAQRTTSQNTTLLRIKIPRELDMIWPLLCISLISIYLLNINISCDVDQNVTKLTKSSNASSSIYNSVFFWTKTQISVSCDGAWWSYSFLSLFVVYPQIILQSPWMTYLIFFHNCCCLVK